MRQPRIQRIATAIVLLSLLCGMLAVPTAVHQHFGGHRSHLHSTVQSAAQTDDVCESSDTNSLADDRDSEELSFPSRFQDISIDAIREEFLFGSSESLESEKVATMASSKQQEVPLAGAHDESIPHMHVHLLGFEFTVNLAASTVVPSAAIVAEDLDSLSSNIQLLNDHSTHELVEGALCIKSPSNNRIMFSIPVFLVPNAGSLLSLSEREAFGVPADEFLASSTILVETPPPRNG